MIIDPQDASPSLVYSTMIRAITPRPIAWVSTISNSGVSNLAPFSYFNGVGTSPAALMFSPVNRPDGSKKDTVRNIESNGQFVVNVVPFGLAESMLKTSSDLEYEESEFDFTGLTPSPSTKIVPPRVAESPIHLECELIQIVNVGTGPLAANVIIGKILLIHAEEYVLNSEGKIEPQLVDSLGRMGGRSYCRTNDRLEIST